MINFTIQFLLGFSHKPEVSKKNQKSNKNEKNVDKKSLEKTNKNKKNKKERDSTSQKETEVDSWNANLIRLDIKLGSAHIEYELIKNRCTYQIDVLCWTNLAKIFSPDGTKIIKTITKNDKTWVPIIVEHKMEELTLEELKSIFESHIEFLIYIGENKLGNIARNHKIDVFCIDSNDMNKEGFIEVYPKLELDLKSHKSTMLTSLSTKSITKKEINVFTKLKYTLENLESIEKYIEYNSFFQDQVISNSVQKIKEKTGKKESKKSKISKSEKSTNQATKNNIQQFIIRGELFFTDPTLTIYNLENPKLDISKTILLVSVENLLTRNQKIYLDPIVIKITTIQNLPQQILKNAGYDQVFCKYQIPFVADCKTVARPIADNIIFNESHIYFTNNISKIKLLEFLDTQRLAVEVWASRSQERTLDDPQLFGDKRSDKDIAKIQPIKRTCVESEQKRKCMENVIAMASYDLSSLLKNIWDYKQKGQLHSLENNILLDFYKIIQPRVVNSLNELNLCLPKYIKSVLSEFLLLENGTFLSIEAYLLAPHSPSLVLHQIPGTFKRLFCVFYEKECARRFLKAIYIHNNDILCNKSQTISEAVLTGFFIDNGNNYACFVEGISIGYILNIWQLFDALEKDSFKVFFNTDMVFEKRLYDEDFIDFSVNFCLYHICLRIPIQDILKKQLIYITGNIPLLAIRSLIKLNLLLHSPNLKYMMQYNLFPTLPELMSMDLEFGVPYRWKPQLTESREILRFDSEVEVMNYQAYSQKHLL